jgi:hypothetical protein
MSSGQSVDVVHASRQAPSEQICSPGQSESVKHNIGPGACSSEQASKATSNATVKKTRLLAWFMRSLQHGLTNIF